MNRKSVACVVCSKQTFILFNAGGKLVPACPSHADAKVIAAAAKEKK